MTDPSLLESLRGQQYLVLQPVVQVASFYDEEQRMLRDRLPNSVSYPNVGHATLRGFYEPDRVRALRAALRTWAAAQPPIALQVDAIDGFPPPYQVLIARLRRSPSLVDAYASLTKLLDSTDFLRIGELPLEQWVFHLSLIYAQTLEDSDWIAWHERTRRDLPTGPAELTTSADFVWYDDNGEHSETLPLCADQEPGTRPR
jgi:hypothetical protein